MSLTWLVVGLLGGAWAAPVVGGQEEPGYPSVVGLGVELGSAALHVCSGTVITPRIVLSAAHCSADYDIETVAQFGKVFVGFDESDPDAVIGLVGGAVHPDYTLRESPTFSVSYDAAVLVLEEDAPVAPSFVDFSEVDDEVIDEELLAVGFGATNANGSGSGVRRSVTMVIDDYTGQALELEPLDDGGNICSGDSGGPMFHLGDGGTPVQWGINSYGDIYCQYTAGAQRLDVVADFVLDQVEAEHGTRDLCVAGGWHDNGTCDEDICPDDPDCVLASDTGQFAGDDDDARACGCAMVGSTSGGALVLVLGVLGLLRRRR